MSSSTTTDHLDSAPLRDAKTAPAKASRPARSLGSRLRWPLMIIAPVLVLVGAGYFYLTGGRYVSTDDAYIQAARTAVSTDVSARVVSISVHDNQKVKAGDTLFTLDSRPFNIAVADARAQLASAKLQITAMKATYAQRQADLKAAQDTLDYEQTNQARQKRLNGSGISSQAQLDSANHAADTARQQVAAAQQQIASVLANLGGKPDIAAEDHPSVQAAQARLDKALLDLSYTVIKAPESGIVTKVDQLQVGDFVNASTPVFSLVSDSKVWVEANFKETELTRMRDGQPATIDVDTYPDDAFHGHVESLSPGTGSSFALLPPENATGNWVKVVQRLPVRIALANGNPEVGLHSGMSVTVTVDTGYRRPLLSMLSSALGGSAAAKTP